MDLAGFFSKSRLRVKLFFLAMLPLLLMLLALLVVVSALHHANDKMGSLYSDRIVPLQQIKVVSDAYAVDLVDVSNKVLFGTIASGPALSVLDNSHQAAVQAWRDYLQTQLVSEESALIKDVEPLLAEVATLRGLIEQAITEQNQNDLQDIVSQQLYPVVDELTLLLKQLSELQLTEAQRCTWGCGDAVILCIGTGIVNGYHALCECRDQVHRRLVPLVIRQLRS